jgi:hypothetical protein
MASQLWSNYDSRYVADYDNDDESGADDVWESSSEENDEDDDSDDDSWIVPDDEVEDESDEDDDDDKNKESKSEACCDYDGSDEDEESSDDSDSDTNQTAERQTTRRCYHTRGGTRTEAGCEDSKSVARLWYYLVVDGQPQPVTSIIIDGIRPRWPAKHHRLRVRLYQQSGDCPFDCLCFKEKTTLSTQNPLYIPWTVQTLANKGSPSYLLRCSVTLRSDS